MASRRLRIEHEGDIVGIRTRVFVDAVERDRDGERQLVGSTEITEAVHSVIVHPLIVGEVARADVAVWAHKIMADAELGRVLVLDPGETRWRVGLRSEGEVVDVFLVLPSSDPELVAKVEAAAAEAGMPLEREA